MEAGDSLLAEREPDNFCCSHRCTSACDVGQGRVRVTARARPASSIASFISLLSTAPAPVVLSLVPLGLG